MERLARSATRHWTGQGAYWDHSFDEAEALDDTYLLVALVGSRGSTTPATPSGWTLASTFLTDSQRSMRIYTRRGNGSVNGISVQSSNTNIDLAYRSICLLAFEGYVKNQVDQTSSLLNGSGLTTNLTPSVTTLADDRVVISAVRTDDPRTFTWPGGGESFDHSAASINVTSAAEAGAQPRTVMWTGGNLSAARSVSIELLPMAPPSTEPPLMLGEGQVQDALVGDTQAAKLYLGDALLWSREG